MREREISAKAADDVAREEVEEEDKAARRKSKKKKKDEKKEKKKSKKDKKKKDEVDDDEYEGSGCEELVGIPNRSWLRSTWVLRNGQWTKIEDKVHPLLGQTRFDNWAERAVFQFHPIHTNASPVVPYYPRLELSIADLFHPRTIDHPTFVNALTEPQVVANALLRIAHGGWDVSTVLISENQNVIQENDMSGFKDKRTKDYWVEEGNQVIRVHNKPRSNLFVPKESSHPTIQEYMLKDERKTLRVNVKDEDDWKERKDNWRTGNNRIPFKGPKWTGRTIFVKKNQETIPISTFCKHV